MRPQSVVAHIIIWGAEAVQRGFEVSVSIGAAAETVPGSIPVPISARGTIGNCAKISVSDQRAEGLEPNSAPSARARSR